MNSFDTYLDENKERFEQDLFEWLRMASIGTDPAYDDQTRAAAEWLARYLFSE